jgi:hypothetical protein
MSKYLSPEQGVTENVNLLEERLLKLRDQMSNHLDWMRVDAVYQIPFRNAPEVAEGQIIQSLPLQGTDAKKLVVHCLTATRIEEGKQHPRETLRAPGVVGLPTAWINELAELNLIRTEIEEQVALIPIPRERTSLWRRWRLLSSLQTMRLTRIVDGPKGVRFYWDTAPSMVVKKATEWIAEFEKHLKYYHDGRVPSGSELSEGDKSFKWVCGIEAMMEVLEENKGDVKVADFRMGQPHIRARVTFHDTTKPFIRPVSAPIVYDVEDKGPSILPLSNWEPDKEHAVNLKRKKIADKPIKGTANLYLYSRR